MCESRGVKREEFPPCHRKSPDHSEKGPERQLVQAPPYQVSTPQRPSPGTETHHSSFRLRWHSRACGHLACERPGKGGLGSGIARHRLSQLFPHILHTCAPTHAQPPMENLCANDPELINPACASALPSIPGCLSGLASPAGGLTGSHTSQIQS